MVTATENRCALRAGRPCQTPTGLSELTGGVPGFVQYFQYQPVVGYSSNDIRNLVSFLHSQGVMLQVYVVLERAPTQGRWTFSLTPGLRDAAGGRRCKIIS